jgi:hypothetical protein
VVKTPDEEQPYKVVLQHEGESADSEHPVSTVRAGELLIRQKSPPRAVPETMREWNHVSSCSDEIVVPTAMQILDGLDRPAFGAAPVAAAEAP